MIANAQHNICIVSICNENICGICKYWWFQQYIQTSVYFTNQEEADLSRYWQRPLVIALWTRENLRVKNWARITIKIAINIYLTITSDVFISGLSTILHFTYMCYMCTHPIPLLLYDDAESTYFSSWDPEFEWISLPFVHNYRKFWSLTTINRKSRYHSNGRQRCTGVRKAAGRIVGYHDN
jgi:hypothetical protein